MPNRSQKPPLSAEALFDLEQRLAAPAFRCVPIGSTLNDLCILQLMQGNPDLSLLGMARTVAHIVYRYFRPIHAPWQKKTVFNMEHRPVLATSLGSDTRWLQLLFPVLHHLPADSCALVAVAPDSCCDLKALDATVCDWRSLVMDIRAWRSEYDHVQNVWMRILVAWAREHGISWRVLPLIAQKLLIQSQRIMACEQLLQQVQPRVIFTEYDRNAYASCLVLAAKSRGISTVTLMHGTINPPYGYTPLLADVACCWGAQHRDQMIALGVDPARLVVTGCARLSNTLTVTRTVARTKAGFPTDKPLVVLASNPVRPEQRRAFVRAFGEAMHACPEYMGLVRLHPSEELAFYANEQENFPWIQFSENRSLSLDEVLAAADIVVAHNSGLGNDALIKGRLTVVFDVLNIPLMNGQTLVGQAGCPSASTPQDLVVILRRILNDNSYQAQLRQRASEYANYCCAAYGQDAAIATADVIKRLL